MQHPVKEKGKNARVFIDEELKKATAKAQELRALPRLREYRVALQVEAILQSSKDLVHPEVMIFDDDHEKAVVTFLLIGAADVADHKLSLFEAVAHFTNHFNSYC